MLTAVSQMGIAAILSIVVAVVPAVMGVAYALWPNEAKLALMRPLSLAGLFGALGGTIGGLINALRYVSVENVPFASPSMAMSVAEALVPLFVAFGSLTIGWLLVAVGMRRHA